MVMGLSDYQQTQEELYAAALPEPHGSKYGGYSGCQTPYQLCPVGTDNNIC
jgi:hypothetical protein